MRVFDQTTLRSQQSRKFIISCDHIVKSIYMRLVSPKLTYASPPPPPLLSQDPHRLEQKAGYKTTTIALAR